MGDRAPLMVEGRVVHAGAPREVYDAPRWPVAAQVVSDPPLNALPLVVVGVGAVLGALGRQALRRDLLPGHYTLRLSAGDVVQSGALQARVVLSEVSGSETVTHLDRAGQALALARMP